MGGVADRGRFIVRCSRPALDAAGYGCRGGLVSVRLGHAIASARVGAPGSRSSKTVQGLATTAARHWRP